MKMKVLFASPVAGCFGASAGTVFRTGWGQVFDENGDPVVGAQIMVKVLKPEL